MFTFNNTNIITGYIKQLLSSTYIPACKIYTQEYSDYLDVHEREDPRIVESFVAPSEERAGRTINYLKTNQIFSYDIAQSKNTTQDQTTVSWLSSSWNGPKTSYVDNKRVNCINKTFKNTSNTYDTATHEYLGDYLRFLKDYHNVNLMSLYNCFNNKIRTNIFCNFDIISENGAKISVSFDCKDDNYIFYAIPVKLFSNYTIAIDSVLGLEMFCSFYNTSIDSENQQVLDLARRTYKKINTAKFNQPFLYDLLDHSFWTKESEFGANGTILNPEKIARADLIDREQDLKLIIKVPVQCKSSITILEGDYRTYNDSIYSTSDGRWVYQRNHTTVNCDDSLAKDYAFKPISRNQLLAFNTGTSYPFADRLIEYLVGSAITPMDEIADNIKRVQAVMEQKGEHFQLVGRWEPKMQKLAYNYMINEGQPTVVTTTSGQKLVRKNPGQHSKFGYNNKSLLFDILGFIDKDTETCYASWEIGNDGAAVKDTIQNINIYDKLYELE